MQILELSSMYDAYIVDNFGPKTVYFLSSMWNTYFLIPHVMMAHNPLLLDIYEICNKLLSLRVITIIRGIAN